MPAKLFWATGLDNKGLKRDAKVAKDEIKGISSEVDKQSKFIQNALKSAFAFVGVTYLLNKIKQLISGNRDLSESFADVGKTTGLTSERVRNLSDQLEKLDSPTSQKGLLDLARIAGKLGITGEKDILGFVKAADQLNVALSEDLGGNAEEAIRQVGKLVDIFKVKQTYGIEQGMLKVGSAINALGAASTANEGYLVDFAQRFGGIAPNADISIQDVLGLAATLDQLGQRVEMSSTALGQLLVSLGKDVPKFAEIAKMSVQTFSELLAKDANEALIAVLEGSKGSQAGLEGMATALEALGLDGARAIGVVGVLGNNIDILRQQQALANKEFEKGTSLTEEFERKNRTLGANLQKIGKHIRTSFINSRFVEWLEKAAQKTAEWIEVPVEQKIKEERQEVNKLIIELTSANTTEAQRKKILDELKSISPTIIEGLKSEKIEVQKLRENLEQYNNELTNRIILANLQKEEEEKLAKLAQVRTDLAKKQADAIELMDTAMKIAQKHARFLYEEEVKIFYSQASVTEKIKQFRDLLSQGGKDYIFTNLLKDILKLEKELNEEELKAIDYSGRIAQIRELLGLTRELKKEEEKGEGVAPGEINYEQELKTFKEYLDKKKSAYEEYEASRLVLGKETADKLFEELLKSGWSYDEFLKKELSKLDSTKLGSLKKIVVSVELAGSIENDRKLIEAAKKDLEEYIKSIEEKTNKLKELTRTYQQEREDIVKKYEGLAAQAEVYLPKEELGERLKILEQLKQEELDAVNEREYAWENYLNEIKKLNAQELRDRIKTLQEELKKEELTAEKRIKIHEELVGTVDELNEKITQNLYGIGDIFFELGRGIGEFNEKLGESVSKAGELVHGLAQVYTSFKDDNIVGAFAASIPVLMQIGRWINGVEKKERERQALNEQLKATITGITDELEKQKSIVDKIAQTETRRLEGTIEAQQKAKEEIEKEIERLNKEIEKKRKEADKTIWYSKHEKLISQSNELAWAAYEYQLELDEINKSLEEYQEQLKVTLTATTESNIADSIIEGFEQGKKSAEDFADDFESLMKQAARNIFKEQILGEAMKQFYNQFKTAVSDKKLTGAEVEELRNLYGTVIEESHILFKELEKMGIDFGNLQEKTKEGLAGAISGITEETAGKIEGQFNAMRMHLAELVDLTRVQVTGAIDPVVNPLEGIQRSTAQQINIALRNYQVLQNIEKNTQYNKYLESIDKSLKGPGINKPEFNPQVNLIRARGGLGGW